MALTTNEKSWKWEHTALRYVINASQDLSVDDLKTLLANRGLKNPDRKATKIDLQLCLMKDYNVELNKSFNNLNKKQLLAELKLRCLDQRTAKKAILIRRLEVTLHHLCLQLTNIITWIFTGSEATKVWR